MGIELTITCNRLGGMELLEETGLRLGMLWQHMIVEVSYAQRPPCQRLRSSRPSGKVALTSTATNRPMRISSPDSAPSCGFLVDCRQLVSYS